MKQVTDRLFEVTDDAGVERLVRGVDAHEIAAVVRNNESFDNSVIAEGKAMLAYQENKARQEKNLAEGVVIPEPTVEGVTTTPKTLLKDNSSNFPINDALFRESQNNPPNPNPDTEGGDAEASLSALSRSELEERAKTHKIDGSGFPNKSELVKAIFKAEKSKK